MNFNQISTIYHKKTTTNASCFVLGDCKTYTNTNKKHDILNKYLQNIY